MARMGDETFELACRVLDLDSAGAEPKRGLENEFEHGHRGHRFLIAVKL